MSEASASPTPSPRPRRRPANPAAAPGAMQPANVNSVGHILRNAREQRNLTLEQIADMLKIRRVYLHAIEESDWEELPELVYAQGFVRSYAAFLNLDEAGAAAQFKREFRGGRHTSELEMPKPLEDNQLPDMKIIGGVIVGLIVLYALWSVATTSPAPEPLPRVAEVQATQETAVIPPAATAETPATPITNEIPAPDAAAQSIQTAATATPDAAAPPQTGIAYGATAPTRITITAAQDSWVQVRDADGQVVFSRVMRPGDSFRVPNEGVLSLTTGNLAGLHFNIDGKGVAPSGTPGTVLRNLPLNTQELPGALAALSKNSETNTPNTPPNNNVSIE